MRLETRDELDARTLDQITTLVQARTDADGHSPLGEHKASHLAVGAESWTGVFAIDETGALLGYAHLLWGTGDDPARVRAEVVVHPDVPDEEGVVQQLMTRAQEVLAQAGGGVLWWWVHRVTQPRETVAYQMGYRIQRELAVMARDLAERPEPPPTPQGIEVRSYRPGDDDAEFLRVNNAAFAGHPENGGWDEREFAARRALDWFEPEGLLIAWRTGTGPGSAPRAVGFHWTKIHGPEASPTPTTAPVGEVYVLGIHPEAQGLGLGRLLLQCGLAHLWDRGCRTAILYVDMASTGAVSLYRSAGFAVAHSEVCYETVVEPSR